MPNFGPNEYLARITNKWRMSCTHNRVPKVRKLRETAAISRSVSATVLNVRAPVSNLFLIAYQWGESMQKLTTYHCCPIVQIFVKRALNS